MFLGSLWLTPTRNFILPLSLFQEAGHFRPAGIEGTKGHEFHHAGAFKYFYETIGKNISEFKKVYSSALECLEVGLSTHEFFVEKEREWHAFQSLITDPKLAHTKGWNSSPPITDADVKIIGPRRPFEEMPPNP